VRMRLGVWKQKGHAVACPLYQQMLIVDLTD
jgi:hypothetical protein